MVVKVQGRIVRRGTIMETAVKLIRREMEDRKLSKSEMARILGCGRPYLHRVLSGEQSPTIEWIENAMAKLGIAMEINFQKAT